MALGDCGNAPAAQPMELTSKYGGREISSEILRGFRCGSYVVYHGILSMFGHFTSGILDGFWVVGSWRY